RSDRDHRGTSGCPGQGRHLAPCVASSALQHSARHRLGGFMIGRLNHVAIAVPDLAAASATYGATLGAKVSAPMAQPAHGVTVVFVELPNTKIELLHPLGAGSPIARFLERNPSGGIHHVLYDVCA